MPVDKEKEKARKKAWYEKNKLRLKAERETKKVNTTLDANHIISILLGAVVLLASCLLVNFSVEVLGNNFQGWVTSILLEIGILFSAIVKPSKSMELKFLRFCFLFFVVLSFFILHAGNEANKLSNLSKDIVLNEKLAIIRKLDENYEALPENRVTDRQKILDTKLEILPDLRPSTSANHLNYTTLASRIMLLIINLIFSHALFRHLNLESKLDPL